MAAPKGADAMARWVLQMVAVLAALAGLIWLLQGIGVLQGSFMTGSTLWAAIGAVLLAAGGSVLVVDQQRHRRKHR
jgi:flagellar biogenesis protein FliO